MGTAPPDPIERCVDLTGNIRVGGREGTSPFAFDFNVAPPKGGKVTLAVLSRESVLVGNVEVGRVLICLPVRVARRRIKASSACRRLREDCAAAEEKGLRQVGRAVVDLSGGRLLRLSVRLGPLGGVLGAALRKVTPATVGGGLVGDVANADVPA